MYTKFRQHRGCGRGDWGEEPVWEGTRCQFCLPPCLRPTETICWKKWQSLGNFRNKLDIRVLTRWYSPLTWHFLRIIQLLLCSLYGLCGRRYLYALWYFPYSFGSVSLLKTSCLCKRSLPSSSRAWCAGCVLLLSVRFPLPWLDRRSPRCPRALPGCLATWCSQTLHWLGEGRCQGHKSARPQRPCCDIKGPFSLEQHHLLRANIYIF